MEESGYGRSQADSSDVVTGVADGIEVEGSVAIGVLVSTMPGRAGCNQYETIKKIMITVPAINQMPNLLLLISPSVILSSFYIESNCLFISGALQPYEPWREISFRKTPVPAS